MDFDKISKENTNKSDNTVPSISECVVCATTSPEKGFIITTRTYLGSSLHVFVQKIKKSEPLDDKKCITICKSCYDSINALEKAQKKVEIYGDDSSDSDSDIKPPKRKNPKMVPCNSLISKFKPYFTFDENEDDNETEGEVKAEGKSDNCVSPTTATNHEIIKKNTTHKCTICNCNFYRFSYGRDFSKENATERPLNCLICEHLFTPRRNKRRKPLNDQKRFGCYICKSRFCHEEGLQPHLKYHTTQTPYECHACGLKFIKRPKLLNHLKNCNPCACEVMCYQVCWGY